MGASAALDRLIAADSRRSDPSGADVILLFAPDRTHLSSSLPSILQKAKKDAIIWIAYPKLTSRLAADLSRDQIREMVSDFALDTVSQIAIDDDWSALRVKRLR